MGRPVHRIQARGAGADVACADPLFASLHDGLRNVVWAAISKSFLLLFFKKEVLFLLERA
jgi:hypothetical protein